MAISFQLHIIPPDCHRGVLDLLDKALMLSTIKSRSHRTYSHENCDPVQYWSSERRMTMEGETSQLPWEALKQAAGDIPWPALHEFAAAVVTDKWLTDALIELYERAWEAGYDHEHYEEFYVPAIFALAAPRLSDQKRREIGVFLVEKLAEAGREDADISMEVLAAACGSMGPVVLPLVLEAIAKEPDYGGAWFHLWGLTEVAVRTEDAELRRPVIRACMELLQEADRGKISPLEAINAAWTLAILGHTDCKELLKRLKKKAVGSFCHGDYDDAVCLLEGRLDYSRPPNLREQPVKEWLETRLQMAKKWYAEHQGGNYEDDEFETGSQRAALLAERFMMQAKADGVDTANEQAMQRYIDQYNPPLYQRDLRRFESNDFAPPIPIVEHSPKIGRNAPCPCGSGKKYKKCCGSMKSVRQFHARDEDLTG
jgi:hypothetical protein